MCAPQACQHRADRFWPTAVGKKPGFKSRRPHHYLSEFFGSGDCLLRKNQEFKFGGPHQLAAQNTKNDDGMVQITTTSAFDDTNLVTN